MFNVGSTEIAVVGLGCVGLPLDVEFGKHFKTVGFDIDSSRIEELNSGFDRTSELDQENIRASNNLHFSSIADDLGGANVYIVTVPTPVDSNHQPNLSPLKSASATVGATLSEGDVVIYESMVYPGATEEDCVPVLEEVSGLKFNRDFYVGYSPERINPGDKQHSVTSIKKVTSGSTPEVAMFVDNLYKTIIKAGTHLASSIKVAEASKVIENTQRDLNIAFINELAIIFNHLDIDTSEVLEAAGTKWNFLPFKPGLVGRHCIGIDPYYLTHKAQTLGYHPDVILSGRKISDGMGDYVVSQLIKAMIQKRIHVHGAKILVVGFSFKENCPDIRNTKVIDIVHGLQEYNADVDIYDPVVSEKETFNHYQVSLTAELKENYYDALILAVAHEQFTKIGAEKLKKLLNNDGLVCDLKSILDKDFSDIRL